MWWILLLAYVALAVTVGYRLGQDVNYDLRNYHFYVPYLAVEGRFEQDIHAAGIQSFLNPILDLPFFFAARGGVPPVVTFLTLTAFHGLALWCVHRIAFLVLPGASLVAAHVGGGLAALTALFGAGYYSELGGTFGDNTVATLVVGALALLVGNVDSGMPNLRRVAAAGVLFGLAAGAKLVIGMFGPGLLLAALWAEGPLRSRVWRGGTFLLAAGLGALATGGYWMWLMYEHYQSPLFPFYNHIFQSPLAPARDFGAAYYGSLPSRQVPFSLPFLLLKEQVVSSEVVFRDARLAVGWLFVLAILAAAAFSRFAARVTPREVSERRLLLLAGFFIVSYAMWVTTVTIYRFAMTLELLAGPLLVGALASLVTKRTVGLAVAGAVCTFLILFTTPPDYVRIPWKTDYFGLSPSQFSTYRRATIVMADFPSAYAAPFFPRSATFIRLVSNWGLDGTPMLERARHRIESTPRNRAYIMEHPEGAEALSTRAALGAMGFTVDDSACQTVSSHFDTLRICPLER